MFVKLDKKCKKYPKEHIISILGDFFLENPWAFHVVDSFQVKSKLLKNKKDEWPEERILDYVLEELKDIYDIENCEREEFKDLWCKISNEDIGLLLEHLVSRLGSYYFPHKNNSFVNESKVYEIQRENGVKIIKQENDFDVIFFYDENCSCNDERLIVSVLNGIEFHEAKKNVTNEIPNNLTRDPHKRMKNKLELMKEIHEVYPNGKYFISTFSSFVDPCQNYLDMNGYDFVEILCVNKLMDRYFSFN